MVAAALALLLAVPGVVSWSLRDAPAPPAPVDGPRTAEPVTHVERRVGERDARAAEADALRHARTSAAPSGHRELRLRVMRRFGDQGRVGYDGPVRVAVSGGEVVFDGDYDGAPLALEVPLACDSVEVRAPDHQPVHVGLDPAEPAVDACATLRPDATVEFVFATNGVVRGGTPVLRLVRGAEGGKSQVDVVENGDLRATAPVPVGAGIGWSLEHDFGRGRVFLEGRLDPLVAGEVRHVQVAVPAGTRYRLEGPSAALLPHCRVHLIEDGRHLGTVTPGADGIFEAVGIAPTRLSVEGVEVAIDRGCDPARCVPVTPLVGVAMVDDGGEVVASQRLTPDGAVRSMRREVHVFARDELPERVFVFVDFARHALETKGATGTGDVLRIRPAAPPVGSVVVRFAGLRPLPDEALRAAVIVGGGPSPAITSSQAHEVADEVPIELPAGDGYRVTLCVSGLGNDRRVVLARDVRVPAGGVVDVPAQWPELVVWRGRVDEPRLGTSRHHSRVTWGPHRTSSIGGRVVGDGAFTFVLVDEALPRDGGRLWYGLQSVPLEALARDDAARSIVVAPTGVLREVTVDVVGIERWQVFAYARTENGMAIAGLTSSWQRSPIVLHEGTEQVGVLMNDRLELLGWFRLRGADRSLTLRRAPGRIITLRCPDGVAHRDFGWLGPDGVRFGGDRVTAGAPREVFVPDGTVAVITGAPDDWHELPIGPGDELVLR